MISFRAKRIPSAFTILELIIVIIIVGVLASLALPRFFKIIEYSRSAEALVNMAAIRQAVERCYLMHGGGNFGPCAGGIGATGPGNVTWPLDIEYSGKSPNSHFDYSVYYDPTPANNGYYIWATRNTRDGNTYTGIWDSVNYIGLSVNNSGATYCGCGKFRQMGEISCPGGNCN